MICLDLERGAVEDFYFFMFVVHKRSVPVNQSEGSTKLPESADLCPLFRYLSEVSEGYSTRAYRASLILARLNNDLFF